MPKPCERLHRLFEASAEAYPDRIAVLCGSERLTYSELDRRANQAAHLLRAAGVEAGDRVGILLERSAWTYVALLATLKAGAAYVPLDTAFPPERIECIAQDAALVAMLTVEALLPRLGNVAPKALALDREAQAMARLPDHCPDYTAPVGADTELCYVIYTSGSTGQPKGVAIEHRSICNFVRVASHIYAIEPTDRVYQGLSIAFDFSIEEIWPTWLAGATLVAGPNDATRLGPELAQFLQDNAITALCCVPTLLSTLDQDVPSLRLINIGGEVCPPELVARWHRPGRRVLNTYGPTEATVTATWAELAPGRKVTIGKPMPTYRVHILDEQLQPLPDDEVGEIVIGGIGVARGYLNREDLNRAAFIPDTFAPDSSGARLYRTGDLGRRTNHGDIEFLGRRDTQVKIRGYRVDLAEIESAMLDDAAVRQAVVVPFEAPCSANGHTLELVAYVVPKNGCLDSSHIARIAENLRSKLPAYMAPRHIESIAAIPLLPSGKVDRTRLPNPTRMLDEARASVVPNPPDGPVETAIAAVWTDSFKCEAISVEDDFFTDLGGNSLYAARAVSLLRKDPRFARLSIADFYAYPTVSALARRALELGCENGAAAVKDRAIAASDRSVACCGALQAAALYALLAFWSAPALLVLYVLRQSITLASLLTLFPLLALLLTSTGFALPLACKWLLLGRVRAGSYPLWGWFYLRWWLVAKLVQMSPLGALTGSPLLCVYARWMGARIGPNCYLGTPQLLAFDLLDIGEGSSIGYDTHITGATIEGGELHLGPIRIGRDCFVGSNSVLQPHSCIQDGGKLGDQSLLPSGATVAAGASWSGSPARPDTGPSCKLAALPPLALPRCWGFVLGFLALLLLPLLAALPGVTLLFQAATKSGWGFLAATPLAGLSFVLLFCLLIVAVKRLVLPKVEPGAYPLDSGFYLRKWLVDKCVESSLVLVHSLYATLYLAPFLRMLGAKIGKRVEVSTASHVTPDLLHIRDESFVADAAVLGAARVFRGRIQIAPTNIGVRAFVGNVALLPAGRELPDRCLLGVMSVPPPGPMPEGSDWVGSPAMFLPRRQESEKFPLEQTFAPTPGLYVRRLSYEYLRVTLPPTLLYALAGTLAKTCVLLAGLGSPCLLFVLFPALYVASALTATGLIVVLKRALVGVYKPQQRPLWSSFVWRSELVTGLYETVTVTTLLNMLTGTPFAAMILRFFGARIGKRVLLNSTFLTEFDLVHVEDDAAIGNNASLQTHLFEDRVMKMSHVHIGRGCSVGARGVVLYDASMQEASRLDALSLLMKGETLLPRTRWRGAPAVRWD